MGRNSWKGMWRAAHSPHRTHICHIYVSETLTTPENRGQQFKFFCFGYKPCSSQPKELFFALRGWFWEKSQFKLMEPYIHGQFNHTSFHARLQNFWLVIYWPYLTIYRIILRGSCHAVIWHQKWNILALTKFHAVDLKCAPVGGVVQVD